MYNFDEQIQFCQQTSNCCFKKQNSRPEKKELLKGKKSRKSQKKAWLSMIKTSYFCVSCLSGDTHRCRTIYNFHVKAPK